MAASFDVRQPLRLSYMIGVYAGVNAFPDVYLVVDGPDCLFFKAEYVQGSHDLRSTLLSADGFHRVAHTNTDTVNVVNDREPAIKTLIRRIAAHPRTGMVLVSALPMAAITGSQYDRLAREVASETGRPVVEVPARSLRQDWYEGYEAVLEAVATGIPLEAGGPGDPADVALVGLFVDRTEPDRMADVGEVVRLASDGAGARVLCAWPSNAPVATLARAGRAGTIVSLPYGRKAARILAGRTGARLVEADVPFGVAASAAFVRAVAGAIGTCERAEAFVAAESAAAVPALAIARARRTGGRRLVFVGDPHESARFPEVAAELGATAAAVVSTRYPPDPVEGAPDHAAIVDGFDADLWVSTTRGATVASAFGQPFVEHGFPSNATHALAAAPHLGFRGAVLFAERVANALDLASRTWSRVVPRRT
jgi:nitrogenase molybdenum-iron protein alpha/beta subunit